MIICDSSSQVGIKYDLLTCHHVTNRCRCSPSPESLDSTRKGKEQKELKKQRTTAVKDQMDVNEDNGQDRDRPDEDMNEGDDEGDKVVEANKKKGRYSKNSKGLVASKATTLSYYPPSWRKLLNLAKACMRLHVAVENGFPQLATAVDSECLEVLGEVVAHFEANQWEVEAGMSLITHY